MKNNINNNDVKNVIKTSRERATIWRTLKTTMLRTKWKTVQRNNMKNIKNNTNVKNRMKKQYKELKHEEHQQQRPPTC